MRGRIYCFHCNKPFKSMQSLRAHFGYCPKKPRRTTSSVKIDSDLWYRILVHTKARRESLCDWVERWLSFGLSIEVMSERASKELGGQPRIPIIVRHEVVKLRYDSFKDKLDDIASAIIDPELPTGWFKCSSCGLPYYAGSATIWTCPKCKRKVIR